MTTKLYRAGSTEVLVRDADEGYTIDWEHLGEAERTLGGTLRKHRIALKASWSITWSHLTSAQKSAIVTQLAYGVAMKWQPPDEAFLFDVVVDSFQINPTNYGWTVVANLTQL
jgi:hypothetical protein